jgi:protein TonB
MRPLPLVLMSSAAVPIPADHSRWFLRTLLVSLLVHGLVLTTVRSCQKAPPPPALTLSVELRTPPPPPPPPPPEPPKPEPPKLEPRKPVAMPQPARPLAPPPPPTPLLTATPEAPQRVDQPVVQRPVEPPPPPPPAPAPAAAPAPIAPPPAPAIDDAAARAGYIRGLSAAVAKQKRYPRLAQQRGWQGEVMLHVVVDASGRLLDVSVERSSGFEALDREALEMVRRAAPFSFANGMKKEDVSMSLPVVFRLE